MTKTKCINLALQGGGTHGAYAWGVLDEILEDGRLEIEAVSATSAGAMNACALAYGLYLGGRCKAREALHDLWLNVHKAGKIYSPVRRTPLDDLMFPDNDNSLSYMFFNLFSRIFSPYQFNPCDINPLRDIMEACIDFDTLRKCDCIKVFINTTNVVTGAPHIFHTEDITLDVVMASAAVPDIFKAVEINGAPYWDGGYTGNPILHPFFHHTDCRDIMIVHINPIKRPKLPETVHDIINRVNEISFNASLLHEVRVVGFVNKLLERGLFREEHQDRYKPIYLHSIRADEQLCDLSVASKIYTDWDFLTSLRDKGREQAKYWLKHNFDDVGRRTTFDLPHHSLVTGH